MKKKIWSVLLTMALVAALMCTGALATGKNEQYIGTDGNMTPATGTCVYITANAETYTFEKDTFYCVSGEYTLGTVTVNSGAKLIIGKTAKLTINKLIGEMTLSDEPLAIFNGWYEAGGFERIYGTCNIVDDRGVYVELYGGTYNALPDIEWWSVGEQFVFRYTEESQTKYTKYGFKEDSDYTVVKCDHSAGYGSDGRCDACRYLCPHTNVTANTCDTCGKTMEAQIGETVYATFAEAVEEATDGDTITLLADCNCDVELAKKLTIELNGHTLKREGGDITIKNEVTINGTKSVSTIDATVAVANGGKLTLNGGTVTALNAAEGGAAELTGGTFASLSREANGPTFAAMLKEGYAYRTGPITFLKPTELDKEELANVTVAECTANEANDAGKCVYCGHAFAAISDGIGYDKLSDALSYNGTVKLCKNVTENIGIHTNVTLDLNGFCVEGTLTICQDAGDDEADTGSAGTAREFAFTLMDSKESAATGYVTAIITTNSGYVKVQSGHVKTLTLYGSIEGYSDKSVLSGGKYDKIAMRDSRQYLAGLTLLPNRNYYFRYTDTKETVDLSYKNTLEKVEVVNCKHETVSTNLTDTLCTVCGRQIVANVGSNHYTIFEDAYEAAKDGDTIVLVDFVEFDADKVKFAKKITISYGNQTMKSDSGQVLKITGDVTFQGKGTYSTSIEVSGTLTLTGNMQLGVADDCFSCTVSSGGKLVVNSGTIEYPLTVKDGGAAKLSGGAYKGITVEGDVTYADLLAEGYVYADNSGNPIKLSDMVSGRSVKVIAHAAHSYTNGVCDYCGAVCGHSTVTGGVCTVCHGVPYQEYNTTTKKFETKACDNYTEINENTTRVGTSGQTTWAVVKKDTTINGTPVFSSAVNLILCDGATLTVNDGLRANGDLTIYGQTKGTGKLAVTNSSYKHTKNEYAAMYINSCALTVHGGNITATVATENIYVEKSCGIRANSFTVYGGTVSATAGAATNRSEGIHAQTMTVIGGTVTGTGTGGNAGGDSYGIYANSSMTVSAGTVKATGGDAGNYSYGISATNMTVSGGTVTAIGGKARHPVGVDASNLAVSGGTLKLTEGSSVYKELTVKNTVTLADLLADGCAYQLYDEDEPSKLEELPDPLSRVYVVTHTHEYESGKCVYCGKAKPSSSGGSSGSSSYPVTPSKAENGTVTADAKKAKAGDTVTVTVKPDEGYEVDSVTVLDKNGNEVAVTENADGTYSFVMPDGKVTITPTFTPRHPPTATPDTPLEPPFDPPLTPLFPPSPTCRKGHGLPRRWLGRWSAASPPAQVEMLSLPSWNAPAPSL